MISIVFEMLFTFNHETEQKHPKLKLFYLQEILFLLKYNLYVLLTRMLSIFQLTGMYFQQQFTL